MRHGRLQREQRKCVKKIALTHVSFSCNGFEPESLSFERDNSHTSRRRNLGHHKKAFFKTRPLRLISSAEQLID
jgi:hypothetical protein